MEFEPCCANQQLAWTQSRVGERWADIYACTSCQHIHKMESWLVPLEWPGAERCVNCGGGYVMSARSKKSKAGDDAPRCEHCGLTAQKDMELHDGLAALHPYRSYVLGAEVAADLGRHILALKLATAATRWGAGDDGVVGRVIRIQALESIGKIDRALDEAYDWAHKGAPPVVWGLIATLEGTSGNLEGSMKALKYGIQVDPDNTSIWADYAELLVHFGETDRALDAATHVLGDVELRDRGLNVIADVAKARYAEGHPHEAKAATAVAGDLVDKNVEIAWLLARIAAQESDEPVALAWLEKVLALDPAHAEAKAAFDQLKPQVNRKRGWKFW